MEPQPQFTASRQTLNVSSHHLSDEHFTEILDTISKSSATLPNMATVSLTEFRKKLSDFVKKAERGEEIGITIGGRLAARVVPVDPVRWKTWDEIAHIFDGPPDPDWEADVDKFDQTPIDPWERRREGDS